MKKSSDAVSINFDTVLTDLTGEPLKHVDQGADGKPVITNLTLALVSQMALLQPHQDETNRPQTDKLRQFVLATKVAHGGIVGLTVEERVLIKERIGKACTALVMGRAFEIIDPEEVDRI